MGTASNHRYAGWRQTAWVTLHVGHLNSQQNGKLKRDACHCPQTGNNPFPWFIWVLQEVSFTWCFNYIQDKEFKEPLRWHKISSPHPETVSPPCTICWSASTYIPHAKMKTWMNKMERAICVLISTLCSFPFDCSACIIWNAEGKKIFI